jgi:stress response protein SCP2
MTLGTWMPDESYKANERLPLIEDTRLKIIDLGTEDDIKELASNIISSATSISSLDEDDFTRIIKDYNIVIDPDKIIFKENIALIGKIILDLHKSDDSDTMDTLYSLFNTATDVLRLAVALCDGDKSLAENTKFTGFKRYQRRVILGLIQNIITRKRDESSEVGNVLYGDIMVLRVPNRGKFEQVLADMNKYRQRWIRLAEVLHSREYAKPGSKFYYAAMAIQIIRTDNMPESYGHKTERYYFTKQYDKLIDHLKKRPGELGRRMDSILRGICAIPNATMRNVYLRKFYAAYTEVADKISSTELLQILSHFKNRQSDALDDMRAFFPKGKVQKYYITKSYVESIPQDVCNTMVKYTTNALIKSYSSRKALGSVYISPSMKNYIVPYSQRSASNTTRPVTRGSQFPINKNAKCLRAFVWWTNIEYDESKLFNYPRRVDIDLSSCVLNEDFIRIGEIWYGNLRSHLFRGVHSGDITNGGDFNGDGASEFIDIDIDSILQNGGRYVAFTVHSYTNQPFNEIGHLRFGWMERQEPNSGEIYEPKTVKMAMDLNTPTTFCVPVLFDCLERKAIWSDLPGDNKWFVPNNIHSTDGVMTYAIKATLFHGKTNMYDLIKLNAKARGHITEDRSLADTIFEPEEETEHFEEVKPLDEKIKVYSPYDVDYFMSDLL